MKWLSLLGTYRVCKGLAFKMLAIRKEVIGKGFLVIIDASKHTDDFWSALDETFCLIEFEILSSREKLLTFVQKDQLLCEYGGEYIYDHHEWISFRKFLEPFINGCRLSGRHLVNLLEELRGSRLPVSSTLTHQMIEQQKRNVTHTFHDEQLRHLEEEGDTILKELHSYRTKSPHNHDYRENLERTSILYDELRKAMAKLARLADKRLNRLEECLQLKTFQEESSQVFDGTQIWRVCRLRKDAKSNQAVKSSPYSMRPGIFLAGVPCWVRPATKAEQAQQPACGCISLSNGRQCVPEASFDQTLCHPKP
ncbi:pleckstrin y domain-containing family G member 4B [Trichonephila clavipes]|nr:pleckstrin y domain-containing family G member 4B [Trichonephila clavipes]